MAQDKDLHQSLQDLTISYVKEISGLKKELSDLQIELDKKENELAKSKLKIGELEAQLNLKKSN